MHVHVSVSAKTWSVGPFSCVHISIPISIELLGERFYAETGGIQMKRGARPKKS